jgi:hypothetical protein
VPSEWSATKNLRWKTDLPGKGSSSPIIWDNNIFVTSYSIWSWLGFTAILLHLGAINIWFPPLADISAVDSMPTNGLNDGTLAGYRSRPGIVLTLKHYGGAALYFVFYLIFLLCLGVLSCGVRDPDAKK